MMRQYQLARVEAMTPGERLLLTFDLGLRGARERDAVRLGKALVALRTSLDFAQGPELALTLETIYAYCQEALEAGNFEEVEHVLGQMRRVWAKAIALNKLEADRAAARLRRANEPGRLAGEEGGPEGDVEGGAP